MPSPPVSWETSWPAADRRHHANSHDNHRPGWARCDPSVPPSVLLFVQAVEPGVETGSWNDPPTAESKRRNAAVADQRICSTARQRKELRDLDHGVNGPLSKLFIRRRVVISCPGNQSHQVAHGAEIPFCGGNSGCVSGGLSLFTCSGG